MQAQTDPTVTLAVSNVICNTTVWCLSVCLISILTLTHQGAPRNAASVPFSQQ